MNFLDRFPRRGAARLAAAVAAASALAACGSSGGTGDDGASGGNGPRVVAASTWEAAFARAAGASDVDVIVPPGISHPPDYDPKPSDIAKVAGADFVLYAAFEGFAPKLKSAAGSKAEMVELQLDNSPASVRKEVTRLGKEFDTADQASKWLTSYDAAYTAEKRKAAAAYDKAGKPPVVAQAFVGWAVELLGAKPVGTYGPQPPTASQVAGLAGKKPGLVLDNSAMPGADALSSIKAKRVTVVNFPDHKLDLLSVYRTNTSALTAALTG